MSERGVFAVDRGIWDHPMFASREPLSRREAWLWLVSSAVWKGKTIFVDRKRIEVARGQLAFSIRFMAEQWGWSKSAVGRFLDTLKTEAMIEAKAGHSITIITICKYDEYQRVSLPDRDTKRDADGTRAGHARDKEEDMEDKETVSEAIASGAEAPLEDPSKAEREYFARGREVLGKQAGGQLAKLLKSNGGNVSLSRSTLELAATKHQPAAFFARAVAPRSQGPPLEKGGFTHVLMDKHQERQHGTGSSEPEFSEH